MKFVDDDDDDDITIATCKYHLRNSFAENSWQWWYSDRHGRSLSGARRSVPPWAEV